MQLQPKAFVVGVFVPPALPGTGQVTMDRLNRIWSDVAETYGFTQLQTAPDQSGATFVGPTPDHAVTIQPPLLQVRDRVELTPERSAERAQEILRIAARHLGLSQFFNLGIRHVYHAPLSDNDARSFILNRILSRGGEELDELLIGDRVWGGVKFVVGHTEGEYALTLEPLQADEMRSLFIDLDAQFPGEASLDSIRSRAAEAQRYVTQSVNRYLDNLALES